MPTLRWPGLRVAAGLVAIAACVPYAALKIAWLAGSSAGAATAAASASLHDVWYTVGNAVTLGLELVAVLLAVTFICRWGLKVPAALLLVPMWVGTGLLAPIALGLPVGLIAQAVVGGSAAPVQNGLHGWVYAMVYGGFIVQAAALLTAFVGYVRIRWAALFQLQMPQLRRRTVAVVTRILAGTGAVIAAGYATMHIAWAIAGPGLAAPPGFGTIAQRSFLASTGLLVAMGAAGVLMLVHRWQIGRRPGSVMVLVEIGWVGAAVAFASGFAEYGLAGHTDQHPMTSLVLGTGTLSGLLLGVAGLLAITEITRSGQVGPKGGSSVAGTAPVPAGNR